MTDGQNGGTWKKLLEYKDAGEWFVDAKDVTTILITRSCLLQDLCLLETTLSRMQSTRNRA